MTAGATPIDETPASAGMEEPASERPDQSPTAAVPADLPASRDGIAAGETRAPSVGDAPAGAPADEHPWPVPEGHPAALPPPADVAWPIPESVPAAAGQPWSVPEPGLGQAAAPGLAPGAEASDRGRGPAGRPWLVGLAVGVVLVLVAGAVVIGVSLRADGGSSSAALAAPARTTAPAPPSPSPTRAYAPVPAGGPGPAYSGATLPLDGIRPEYVSVSRDGVLYVSGYTFNRATVYRIDPDGTVTPIIGDEKVSSVGGESSAGISGAGQVDWDDAGNLYVPDINGYRIRKIDTAGVVTTVAGVGLEGDSGDGGPAVEARVGRVEDVAVLGDGTIYFGDLQSNRVRRITPEGIITTVAGTGQPGFTRGPASATSAKLGGPNTIEDAPDGSIYFTNIASGTVQRISPDGRLTTVAGSGYWDISANGRAGEGRRATSSAVRLTVPSLGLGPDGSLYLVSPGRANVRKVGPDGVIRTIAGTGGEGAAGDGGPATAATFLQPRAVAADVTGAVYVVDGGNEQVRRIATDGTITTVVRSTG
ncbi:NHL repeat containing protein [Pseudofrankia inefficax]|uniref:NHL repeat containing protein n=1 Tax=Pseudofrankia inefficax (strain DSM 45817 / CECT 9037 / DDB 130130 / EuI1c) TaxID=298654 RepID=E3J1H1_PSEI1|nr:NHL repeat containing protein [Pseudofrankia inefficax]ADP81639.1 NHL repeat containing protein [Pseudofrankia inefficax]